MIVEGQYDKITLSNVLEAVIVPTDGFGIFKNAQKRALIRRMAQKNGVLIITDSDAAGRQIRAHIKNICADADILNAYIPKIKGKERRKNKPGKEGILGVEGQSAEVLTRALIKSGITKKVKDKSATAVTKQDMYAAGLSGRTDSAALRKSLAKFLEIPEGMSANALLDAINSLYTKTEFETAVKKWRQEQDKN